MIEISFENWKYVCEIYLFSKDEKNNYYGKNLQLYSFLKMDKKLKNEIISQHFYEKYVRNYLYVFDKNIMFECNNPLMKNNNIIPNSLLVSPILFLIYEAYGKTIHDNEKKKIKNKNVLLFFDNIFEEERNTSLNQYNEFREKLSEFSENRSHFIRFNIFDFYSYINIDDLFLKINEKSGSKNSNDLHLIFLKSFVKYLGNGRFPLIQNSSTSSFLSTSIYLEDIDNKIHNFLSKYSLIEDVKMLRYIDDIYILFNCKETSKINEIFYRVKAEYCLLLQENHLVLNNDKSYIDSSKVFLNTSFDTDIKQKEKSVLNFLNEIEREWYKKAINKIDYKKLIINFFVDGKNKKKGERNANNYFNSIIYGEILKNSKKIENKIMEMLNKCPEFLLLDPKRLFILANSFQSNEVNKKIFSFLKSNKNNVNVNILPLKIYFLVRNNFDIKFRNEIMTNKNGSFLKYYNKFLGNSINNITKLLNENLKINYLFSEKDNSRSFASFLYFNYICENKYKNNWVAFAFFKSYFDWITTLFLNKKNKGGNHYKIKEFFDCYKKIKNSKKIISDSNQLRNISPMIHPDMKFFDSKNINNQEKIIEQLKKLISSYIKQEINN